MRKKKGRETSNRSVDSKSGRGKEIDELCALKSTTSCAHRHIASPLVASDFGGSLPALALLQEGTIRADTPRNAEKCDRFEAWRHILLHKRTTRGYGKYRSVTFGRVQAKKVSSSAFNVCLGAFCVAFVDFT